MRALAALIFSGLAFIAIAAEQPLPQDDSLQHKGVATCGTSVCHGKNKAVAGQHVWLNEYRLWATEDHHSRAYKTLLSPESKKIAQAMGLPAAHTAKACLDCHSDNVAKEQRGPKFQLSDGVGCESCHGGSEKWLKSHTDPDATHSRNLQQGMYPTENGFARAKLCLSCHMGDSRKFAHHGMMAAGHPRLVFEMETFSVNQPAHYAVDADYHERKGKPAIASLWLAGQLMSARQQLQLIAQHGGKITAQSLAIYDCHSCHQPMQKNYQPAKDNSRVLPVGSMRVSDFSQDMLEVIYSVLWPEKQAQWQQQVQALHLASSTFERAEIASASEAMISNIDALQAKVAGMKLQASTAKALRKGITKAASAGVYADFASAEQAFLAIENLSYSLQDHKALTKTLDAIYSTMTDENRFQAKQYQQKMQQLLQQL